MSEGKVFLDTNILIYLLSQDLHKAEQVEALLRQEVTISVQVLNELTSVARRKLKMPWAEIREFVGVVRALCTIEPVTLETHACGMQLAERYHLSWYDANIVASALLAGCAVVYSEDMHSGLLIEQKLCIRNPF